MKFINSMEKKIQHFLECLDFQIGQFMNFKRLLSSEIIPKIMYPLFTNFQQTWICLNILRECIISFQIQLPYLVQLHFKTILPIYLLKYIWMIDSQLKMLTSFEISLKMELIHPISKFKHLMKTYFSKLAHHSLETFCHLLLEQLTLKCRIFSWQQKLISTEQPS